MVFIHWSMFNFGLDRLFESLFRIFFSECSRILQKDLFHPITSSNKSNCFINFFSGTQMLSILVPILIKFLADRTESSYVNKHLRSLHDQSIQILMKIGPLYPQVSLKRIIVHLIFIQIKILFIFFSCFLCS